MEVPFALRWTALLEEAVNRPGLILEAYSRFHGYSIGNRIAALFQCMERQIEPGPIATFTRWKELGRSVKKGSKALWLCMPMTVTRRPDFKDPDGKEHCFTYFVWLPRWFVLCQTDGKPYEPEPIPHWSKEQALNGLGISELAFDGLDGNVQGYAKGRAVAVNPLAEIPSKTLFHEIGHVLLGHTGEGEIRESKELPRNLKETEAESVAFLCLDALGLSGEAYCRGYIQHWYGAGNPIPEASARRIFGAADAVLKAGRVETVLDGSLMEGGLQ